jgi:hypothetical protein
LFLIYNDLGLAIVHSVTRPYSACVLEASESLGERKGGWGGEGTCARQGETTRADVNRSPGGIQAAVQQAIGVGVTPTWEKLLFLEADSL